MDPDTLSDWRSADTVARWICTRLLALIEHLYLIAYGWKRTGYSSDSEAAWAPPLAHPKAGELYGRSHAVNSMRYYLGTQQPRKNQRSRGSDQRGVMS